MERFAMLLLLSITIAPFATAQTTAPADPPFAVRATERLVIRAGARIRGGAVGAFDSSRASTAPRSSEATLDGARIVGDVYGELVRLTGRAKVRRAFATTFLADDGARYREMLDLPAALPSAPLDLPTTPGDGDVIVPPGARVRVTSRPARIEVGRGGTLVVPEGQMQLERLVLGEGSRLEVEGPTRLLILRAFHAGPRAIIGTTTRRLPLNLSIVVQGSDAGPSPRVSIGARSRLRAVLSAPHGRIVLGERVRAIGSVFGRDVEIGRQASVDLPPGLIFDYDVCHTTGCDIDATAGGQIKVHCRLVPVKPGTPCDDGQLCTKNDACDEEAHCVGKPVLVPASTPDNPYFACVRDTCDPTWGIYEAPGTPCGQLAPCRESFTCDGQHGDCTQPGALLPAGSSCDDGIPNNGTDMCAANGWCHGSLGQYDCLANNCSAEPGAPPDLECWLTQHPHIRGAISWKGVNTFVVDYDAWEPWRKASLQQAFVDAWNWYANGMSTFDGTLPPDPLTNQEPLADLDGPLTVLDENDQAWPIYVAAVAHTLAAEAGHWLPWSLCDYGWGSQEVKMLVSSWDRYWAANTVYPGLTVRGPTPAHVTRVFTFLSDNGLIGATRHETILNVIDWARRLLHFFGDYTTINFEGHWQYRGSPPMSHMLDGTHVTVPPYDNMYPDPEHWTAGCSGTTAFLKELLRTVNIPMKPVFVCGHALPYFVTEGQYLTHGDDPYSGFREGSTTVMPSLEEFLIDEPKFAAWFGGPEEEACDNVGRRQRELMVQYLPDWLVQTYCYDETYGHDHESSWVYESLKLSYSVADLEALGFWDNLAQRAAELGYTPCGS